MKEYHPKLFILSQQGTKQIRSKCCLFSLSFKSSTFFVEKRHISHACNRWMLINTHTTLYCVKKIIKICSFFWNICTQTHITSCMHTFSHTNTCSPRFYDIPRKHPSWWVTFMLTCSIFWRETTSNVLADKIEKLCKRREAPSTCY